MALSSDFPGDHRGGSVRPEMGRMRRERPPTISRPFVGCSARARDRLQRLCHDDTGRWNTILYDSRELGQEGAALTSHSTVVFSCAPTFSCTFPPRQQTSSTAGPDMPPLTRKTSTGGGSLIPHPVDVVCRGSQDTLCRKSRDSSCQAEAYRTMLSPARPALSRDHMAEGKNIRQAERLAGARGDTAAPADGRERLVGHAAYCPGERDSRVGRAFPPDALAPSGWKARPTSLAGLIRHNVRRAGGGPRRDSGVQRSAGCHPVHCVVHHKTGFLLGWAGPVLRPCTRDERRRSMLHFFNNKRNREFFR